MSLPFIRGLGQSQEKFRFLQEQNELMTKLHLIVIVILMRKRNIILALDLFTCQSQLKHVYLGHLYTHFPQFLCITKLLDRNILYHQIIYNSYKVGTQSFQTIQQVMVVVRSLNKCKASNKLRVRRRGMQVIRNEA